MLLYSTCLNLGSAEEAHSKLGHVLSLLRTLYSGGKRLHSFTVGHCLILLLLLLLGSFQSLQVQHYEPDYFCCVVTWGAFLKCAILGKSKYQKCIKQFKSTQWAQVFKQQLLKHKVVSQKSCRSNQKTRSVLFFVSLLCVFFSGLCVIYFTFGHLHHYTCVLVCAEPFPCLYWFLAFGNSLSQHF